MYTLNDLVRHIGEDYRIVGSGDGIVVENARPIHDADPRSVVWVSPKRDDRQALAERTAARIIVCDETVDAGPLVRAGKCLVRVANPRLAFIRIVTALFARAPVAGVHPTASVDPGARVHPDAYVGPFTWVGRSSVGAGTVIYGHCHIYDGVTIGKDVVIHAGTVIGSDGFGYSRNEAGGFEKFPHLGGVTIGDGVEIGANSCIDRGTLGDTVIREGAKIDNLVHVAHNVVVGAHAAVIAHAMLGGSVSIGDHAWVAPAASLKEGLKVGDRALIGLGAVVLKDVPDGETWIGNPARPMKEYVAMMKRLKGEEPR